MAQLKYRNISEYGSVITALIVALQPLDVSGNLLGEEIEYQYLDLSVAVNEEFGQKTPIYLPDSTTRGLQVRVVRTIFENGNILSSEEQGKEYFQPLPTQHSISEFIKDDKSRDQYVYEHGNSCKYAPLEYKDLWICCCGGINKTNAETCILCKSSKESVLNVDIDKLIKNYVKREENRKNSIYNEAKEQMTLGTIAGYKSAIGLFEQVPDWEDSSSLVLQCQERIVSLYKAEKDRCERLEEQKRIAAEKVSKKRRKIIKGAVASVSITAFLVAIVVMFVTVGLPEIRRHNQYSEAQELLASKKYDEAKNAYDKLGDYKDSKQMAQESLYEKADSLAK